MVKVVPTKDRVIGKIYTNKLGVSRIWTLKEKKHANAKQKYREKNKDNEEYKENKIQ